MLEAGRFDGYGLSRTGIDGDTQEAIWVQSSLLSRRLVVASRAEGRRLWRKLSQQIADGWLGPVLHRAMQSLLQDTGIEAPAGQRASKGVCV